MIDLMLGIAIIALAAAGSFLIRFGYDILAGNLYYEIKLIRETPK